MFVQACNRKDAPYTDSKQSTRDLRAARRDRD